MVAVGAGCTGWLGAETLLTGESPMVIPNTTGRFDFIEMDQGAERLLAAHTGNGTLDVFDAEGKLLKAVRTGKAQAVAVDAMHGQYYVAVSEQRKIVTVKAATLEVLDDTPLMGPADLIAYDPKNHTAYAGHDDGAEVWAVNLNEAKTTSIAIPEGPEGIVYDGKSDRVYANAKSGDVVVVIDPGTNKAVASWPTAPVKGPHGSALDAEGQRLFVVGGNGKLVAFDLKTGKIVSWVEVAAKVDEIAYDAGLHRIYCASGSGVLSVVDATGELKALGEVPTHQGAHSVAVDEKSHAVWIAYGEGSESYIQRFK
ncbi:hypothetical protein BH09VER1_BH09VER1_45980 [soil metagenome]